MTLCEWQTVMKQSAHGMVLKDVALTIEAGQHAGIKFTQTERQVFYDLLTGQDQPTSGQILRSYQRLASCRLDDGLYDHLSVRELIQFFGQLTAYPADYQPLYEAFALVDVLTKRVSRLTPDQRYRLLLLRAALNQPDLLYIESPLALMSHDGVALYLKAVDYLKQQPMTLLFTATALEELVLLNLATYRYQVYDGLELVDVSEEDDTATSPKETDDMNATDLNRVFKVACKLSDKTVYFNPNEIDYIESINSVSTVQVNGESYPTTMTLADLEDKLKHFGFFRCHRSYLVNLQRIHELVSYSKNSYTLILKKPKETMLPLSRTRLEELRQLIEL